jgi:hypothetical protein
MTSSAITRRWRIVLGAALAATVTLGGTALAVGFQHAGPRKDGTAVTPIGLTVTPAGKQTNLDDLPLAAISSPDGRWLVISNDGQGIQSLQVVDTATSNVTQPLTYPAPKALFVGLAFAPNGNTLYASGAAITSSAATRSTTEHWPKAHQSCCLPPTQPGRTSTYIRLGSRSHLMAEACWSPTSKPTHSLWST